MDGNKIVEGLKTIWFGLFPTVTVTADLVTEDDRGWRNVSHASPHDRDYAEIAEVYEKTSTALLRDPLAAGIVKVTAAYVIGKGITFISEDKQAQRFLRLFWANRRTKITEQIEGIVNELTKAGDVFVLLIPEVAPNKTPTGMSWVRLITKDEIVEVTKDPHDRDTLFSIFQKNGIDEPKEWLTIDNPAWKPNMPCCFQLSINRTVGATFGEGDLTTSLPWLQRHSRLIDLMGKVLQTATAYLYTVTVPKKDIKATEKLRSIVPPPGSIVIKEPNEEWDVVTPKLQLTQMDTGAKDMRGMVHAGTLIPPHWIGDPTDANLATARAMEQTPERILHRRQKYIVTQLTQVLFVAYKWYCSSKNLTPPADETIADELFTAQLSEITQNDNLTQAQAAQTFTTAVNLYTTICAATQNKSIRSLALSGILKMSGMKVSPEEFESAVTLTLLTEKQA